MKEIIVLASSNQFGNTRKFSESYIEENHNTDFVSLIDYEFSFYDYEHNNQNDDFISLIEILIEYDEIIFASPVYWYSMSAQLKVFFDRLSDLLVIRKDLGYKLKGKTISIISTGSDEQCPDCFIEPFKLTANYLGMNFNKVLYQAV